MLPLPACSHQICLPCSSSLIQNRSWALAEFRVILNVTIPLVTVLITQFHFELLFSRDPGIECKVLRADYLSPSCFSRILICGSSRAFMEGPGCCNTVCLEENRCNFQYTFTRSSDWREIIQYSSLLQQRVRKWSLLFLGRLTEFKYFCSLCNESCSGVWNFWECGTSLLAFRLAVCGKWHHWSYVCASRTVNGFILDPDPNSLMWLQGMQGCVLDHGLMLPPLPLPVTSMGQGVENRTWS